MKVRTWMILGGVLVGLILILFLLENRSVSGGDDNALFVDFERERALKIEVSGKDGEGIVLEKAADGWKVPAEGDFPAEPDGVGDILDFLDRATTGHKVSENPEKRAIFEVEPENGLTVRVSGEESAVLASFFIGKTGPDFTSTYIRPEDSDAVYLMDEPLRRLFVRPSPRQWRDKAIFRLSSVEITHVRWEMEEQPVALEVDTGGNWILTEPSSAPAVRSEAEVLRNSLATLQADDFATGASEVEAGFDVPYAMIEFKLRNGTVHTLEIGAENDRSQRHLRRDGGETIFLVNNFRINSLLKSADELKAPPPDPDGTPIADPAS